LIDNIKIQLRTKDQTCHYLLNLEI